jgi:dienelactone hydrolase
MITQVTKSQNVDPKRVFVTGFSAGAAFTYIVACKLSSQVAGIAPVSAVMNTVVTAPCALAHPISQLTIIGNQDGAFNGRPPRVLSAAATAATWRAKNNCPSSTPSFTGRSGSAQESVWSNCADGSAVGLYVILGGAHYWPGNSENAQFGLPPSHPDRQFNASNAIWAFLSGHAAGSNVTASISGIRVHNVNHRSVVMISFRLGEPVVVACTLGLGLGRKLTRTLHLGRGSHTRAVLKAPRGTKAGRHPVTCVFKDSYSRVLTQRRKVTLT